MRKYKRYLEDSTELLKEQLAELLAAQIYLYYTYYKNKKFESFEQYCNSYNAFFLFNKKETLELYHKVDSIIEEKYNLFFAHYELDEPIYLVDISGKEES